MTPQPTPAARSRAAHRGAVLRSPKLFELVPRYDAESNALSEKDIVEVAEGKYRADDPVHTNREFRDQHDGTDTITHIQRL